MSTSPITPSVTVSLSKQLAKFNGRHLDFDQMKILIEYCANTSGDIDWNLAFDGGEFTGIVFYKLRSGKYSIWALHDSLEDGPVFNISPPKLENLFDPHFNPFDQYIYNNHNEELRQIVTEYLTKHPELGLTIEQFM